MATIFICYRHEDCAGSAGRLYDRLKNRFPRHLMDLDFPGADNFENEIKTAIRSCYAVIVLIGKRWLDMKDSNRKRRLDNPEDWVRYEIEYALRKKIPLVPVLVEGGVMPRSEELPVGLKKLSKIKSIEIRHDRFEDDLAALVRELERIIHTEETRHRRIHAAATEAFRTYASLGSSLTRSALDSHTGDQVERSDFAADITKLILQYYTPEVLSRLRSTFAGFGAMA